MIIVAPNNPYELANIIIGVLRDDKHRVAIGERTRQTVLDHFSWDSVCEQTVQVYESVSKKK